jgi:CHASE2 domain-containing sensor protein
MAKLVKLSLEGDLTSGYEVELIQISEEERDGKVIIEGIGGKLPAAAEIYECYQTWQQNYEQLDRIYRGGEFRFLGVETNSNVSLAKCQQLSQSLEQKINDWLDAPGFRAIADSILTYLSPEEDIRFLIKTSDYNLWQIPWSAWIFFETHPNAEVVFSSFDAKYGEKPIKATPRKNVRILSVFGSDENINTKPDREQIERLKSVGAEPTLIVKPRVDHLRNLLWDKSWDIFFFAGHGDRVKNATQGKIYLNSEEALTPSEFKNTLKTAIVDRGLKIAFLNSCVGLEFAYELVTDFGIPVVIAMREPIPDGAAQKFLEYFLLEYADRGRPLYVAVRRAKERISEELQTEYPSLDWLPVVCQNPSSIPPIWQDLHNKISLKKATFTSLFCTFIIVFVRTLGFFQPTEFAAYDWFIRARSTEQRDERILLITVDEEDIQYQIDNSLKREGSLSDEALFILLQKILPYQPNVVGLDIYHDFPFRIPELSEIIQLLAENSQFIGVCRLGNAYNNNRTISRPPEIPHQMVGFTDMPLDPDHAIRRQFFGLQSFEECDTSISFSLNVALRYLENHLTEQRILEKTSDNQRKIKDVLFKKLQFNSGGYQLSSDAAGGYTVLINYRNAEFKKISLHEILDGTRDQELEELVKDKIILIGLSEPGKDDHITPFSWGSWPNKMPGVEIHAHKISQITSAVLDNRQLLWTWAEWVEILWISSVGFVGGLIVWKFRYPIPILLGSITAIWILGGICWLLFLQGGWIPLIPPSFVLILTPVTLRFSRK